VQLSPSDFEISRFADKQPFQLFKHLIRSSVLADENGGSLAMDTAAQATGPTFSWQETGSVTEADQLALLEAVVRQHARFIFKVAYGVLRNPHDAEDVVQEVYLRVHRSGIKDVEDMRAWLARVTFRLAIDRLRKPQGIDLADLESPATSLMPSTLPCTVSGWSTSRSSLRHCPKTCAIRWCCRRLRK
jgi:sigma-70-like protein